MTSTEVKSKVAVMRYERPNDSVGSAIAVSGCLDHIRPGAKVFVKPNIVYRTRAAKFPKWGVITTTRVVEDVVRCLKDLGVRDIVIGEGSVTTTPNDKETQRDAFKTLGYDRLEENSMAPSG